MPSVPRTQLITRSHWWFCYWQSTHDRLLGLICSKLMEFTIFSQWTTSQDTWSDTADQHYVCCSDQRTLVIFFLDVEYQTVWSDNGPQYSPQEFVQVCKLIRVQPHYERPDFLKSNGQVEGIGQTVERLLKRSNDPYLALLSYCATPLPRCDLSPTQLSIGRRIRTPIPQTNKLLVLNWGYLKTFCE